MSRFYITTPIYYSNDEPHIGHTATTIYADIVARHRRLLGDDVIFLTGTDEHGEKLAEAATKAGKKPQEFVDAMAQKWQAYWQKLNITNDIFMRTTHPKHKEIARELLSRLKKKRDVYEGVYEGIYCVGCEEFKSEKDLVDGKCPEHRPDQIQYKKEENYFFKISNYIPRIKKLMESGEFPVIPENKKNEMLARLNGEIADISISRQKVAWGIPIPWDEKQTTYVWIEALMNYYSALFILDKEEYWPADVHFVGKGNNWFHTVIWPCLLLALDLPLPKQVFVHGYYNVEGRKMGKSLGNVISPQELLEKYGSEGTRYLLAASMPYENDSDVSMDWFNEKFNTDLANGFGNLVSRVAKLAEGMDGITTPDYTGQIALNPEIQSAYTSYKLQVVVSELQELVSVADQYLNENQPWNKEGEAKTRIIEEAVRKVLSLAVLAEPVLPGTSGKVREVFEADRISGIEPLFRRIG